MRPEKLETEYRLNLLFEMLDASYELYHWTYDSDGNLLYTNTDDKVLDTIFATTDCKQLMLQHSLEADTPLILDISFGLLWVAAYEKYNGELYRIHVLGPTFNTEVSVLGIQKAMQKHQVPAQWKSSFSQILMRLPVISISSLTKIAIMLHYCVTGEKIQASQVTFSQRHNPEPPDPSDRRDRHRTWMAEQQLLNMIREGNLNYQSAVTDANAVSDGVDFHADSPVAQAKVSVIVFISLCTRAAIDGGIIPDVAYSTGDGYIQQVNNCDTISHLGEISGEAYDYFVRMVHEHKKRTGLSKPILACVEYIDLHLEDDLKLEQLADRLGYTNYYLSRKFRQETNHSINEYIRKQRVNRACQLLTTTDEGLQEISERLHFSSRSHFSVAFKEITGVSPSEYRESHKNP